MSFVVQKPVVPCSVCKDAMVELGPMGDTGTKKCPKCKYLTRREYHIQYYKRTFKFQKTQCIRCGNKFESRNAGRKASTCETCQMLIVDLFRASQNQDCIFCGKPSGIRKFCSHACLVNTTVLAKKRKMKIDMVLKD